MLAGWPDPGRRLGRGHPQRVSDDDEQAARVLAQVARVPALTWGRDELELGEMWNSNSLVAWLLSTCGLDASRLAPPRGGRAPGWTSGLVLAGRVPARDGPSRSP